MFKLALLMGGDSLERKVSLKSGKAVEKALKLRGYSVEKYELKTSEMPTWRGKTPNGVFLALHGGKGENGYIQTQLESANIPYTGSGPKACQIAMDKLLSKRRFIKAGLSTPYSCLISSFWPFSLIQKLVEKDIQYPMIIKPCKEGSSIGVFLVKNSEELKDRLSEAFEVSRELLVEKYISGREFTAAILDDQVLPLVEITTKGEFFDYQAKYEDGQTRYLLNPNLPIQVEQKLKSCALKAHRALGCRHFSRVDLIWSQGEFQVLEINTIPGLTSTSLLPMSAKAQGYSFGDLCEKMVFLALGQRLARRTG